MNLPNKLTVLRIILMPVMVALFFCGQYIPAAIVFVLAAFTDMLDGKIARKRKLVTVFGKFVDPLADKLINIAAIVILSGNIMAEYSGNWYGILALVATVIIISREIIITSFRTLAVKEGVVIAADKMGKLKTVIQDVCIVAMMLDEATLLNLPFLGELLHWTAVVLLCAAVILTVFSGVNYFTSNKEVTDKIFKDI